MKSIGSTPPQTVEQLLRELRSRAEAAEARAIELEQKNGDLEQKNGDLEQKNGDLEQKNGDLEQKNGDLEQKYNSMEHKLREIAQQAAAQDKLINLLMDRIVSLTRRLAEARNRPEQLALEFELKAVQRQLDNLNRDKFAQSSERRGRPKDAPKKEKPPKKEQTGHGPTPQPGLEMEPKHHKMDDADCICPKCMPPRRLVPWEGKTLDSEEITVFERVFKLILHQRQIYRCEKCGHIETALGPEKFPGGRYSLDFAATVADDKYNNALPLSRQARIMGEQGLVVTSQTLWDQLGMLYALLLPTYLILQQRILESEVVYVDETTWRLMKKGKSKKWWVWVITDGRRVFFLLAPTRGQGAARQLLGDYDGIVMADRYKVYETLEKERTKNGGQQLVLSLDGEPPKAVPTPDYTLVACWMHGRRGFIKAERQGEEAAETALDWIAQLYAIEARAQQEVEHILDPTQREAALLAVRERLRQSESRPVIARLRQWLDEVKCIPTLPLDKAIQWLDNGWEQLIRFLDDPRIPLDNGLAERVIRWVVLGRKTYAGSRSEKGTQVAALFYSLRESCRLSQVSFREYLVEAGRRALRDRESVFLPEDYAKMLAEQPTAGHDSQD
jgi:transposase